MGGKAASYLEIFCCADNFRKTLELDAHSLFLDY